MRLWMWIAIACAALAAAVAIALVYWNNAVKVLNYDVKSKKLPKAFDGFKIAHISDFHNKYYGKGARRLVKKIAGQRPDIIAVSGDMIQTDKRKNAVMLMRELVKIAPTYYVSGNHERYVESFGEFLSEICGFGVRYLADETVFLERRESRIAVSGAVDPRFYMERGNEAADRFKERLLPLRKENEYNILISHRPEFMAAYATAGFDLVLSGHAHAGQVRLPFVGAIFTPGERFHPKYVVGRYEVGETVMIVSGGLGSSSWIPRVLNRPQLLFETLKTL